MQEILQTRKQVRQQGNGFPTPPRGRPQGSPPYSPPLSPLQRYGTTYQPHVVFVRARVGLMWGWDPCGRPQGRVERSTPSHQECHSHAKSFTVALGWCGGANRPHHAMAASYPPFASQLVKSLVTFISFISLVTVVALVALVTIVTLVAERTIWQKWYQTMTISERAWQCAAVILCGKMS